MCVIVGLTYELWKLGQVMSPFCGPVFSSVEDSDIVEKTWRDRFCSKYFVLVIPVLLRTTP